MSCGLRLLAESSPNDADPFAYEEVAGAVLLIRKLNALTADRAYRELLIDSVLIPALKRGGESGQHGIFSGQPTPAASDVEAEKDHP